LGILNILSGVFSIPLGIFLIIAGINLYQAANAADRFKYSGDEASLLRYHEKLNGFFTMMGIYAIVALILLILVFVLLFVVFGSLMSLSEFETL